MFCCEMHFLVDRGLAGSKTWSRLRLLFSLKIALFFRLIGLSGHSFKLLGYSVLYDRGDYEMRETCFCLEPGTGGCIFATWKTTNFDKSGTSIFPTGSDIWMSLDLRVYHVWIANSHAGQIGKWGLEFVVELIWAIDVILDTVKL